MNERNVALPNLLRMRDLRRLLLPSPSRRYLRDTSSSASGIGLIIDTSDLQRRTKRDDDICIRPMPSAQRRKGVVASGSQVFKICMSSTDGPRNRDFHWQTTADRGRQG